MTARNILGYNMYHSKFIQIQKNKIEGTPILKLAMVKT